MLIVQDDLIKLGGKKISGQIISISISETAKIEDIKDDKGKTKANQPTGYEAAKITVKFWLEKKESMSVKEEIKSIQRLFRPYKQKKAKLLKIANEQCSARGISKVYFKSFSTDDVTAESKTVANLEFLAPTFAGIKLKKKSNKKKKAGKNAKKSKSKKSTAKSPTTKKRSTAQAKSKAKSLLK